MGSCKYSQFDEKTAGNNEKFSLISFCSPLDTGSINHQVLKGQKSTDTKSRFHSSAFKVLLCKLLQKATTMVTSKLS